MFNTNIDNRKYKQTVNIKPACCGLLQKSHPHSFFKRFHKTSDIVIIPNVGDDIVLDIDDCDLKGNEYKVVRVVYPLPNLDYKVNIYVSKNTTL